MSREAWDDLLRLTGLTQTRVAQLSEVPRATIASLQGGHHKAALPTAHKIAGALGVAPATLFPSLRKPRHEAAA